MTTANIAPDLLPLAQPIDTLHEMPGNPRRGDIEAVARSYERFGQRKPIVARRDGTVIAGNHQLKAARKLGWDRIAVIYTDDDDQTAKAYALADNRTSELGEIDPTALAEMISSVDDAALLVAAGYGNVNLDEFASDGPVPDFAPVSEDSQPRLDQRNPIMCPQCAFEWRVGPKGEIEPV